MGNKRFSSSSAKTRRRSVLFPAAIDTRLDSTRRVSESRRLHEIRWHEFASFSPALKIISCVIFDQTFSRSAMYQNIIGVASKRIFRSCARNPSTVEVSTKKDIPRKERFVWKKVFTFLSDRIGQLSLGRRPLFRTRHPSELSSAIVLDGVAFYRLRTADAFDRLSTKIYTSFGEAKRKEKDRGIDYSNKDIRRFYRLSKTTTVVRCGGRSRDRRKGKWSHIWQGSSQTEKCSRCLPMSPPRLLTRRGCALTLYIRLRLSCLPLFLLDIIRITLFMFSFIRILFFRRDIADEEDAWEKLGTGALEIR